MRKLSITGLFIAGAMVAALPASAGMLDLTTAGSSGTIGSAFFIQVDPQATGTGLIDPFLRVQANDVEQGVNSDGPYTMDEKAGIWTHSIRVDAFGVVDLNGTPSIRFLLDINETTPSKFISLDMLKIYVAPVATYNTLAQLDANGTLIYDMDAPAPSAYFGAGASVDDNWVKLDYDLNSGSGSGDMLAYLPYSMFAPHTTKYLYLFSRFGDNFDTSDGFEEWARIDGATPPPPPPEIPEPGTLLLLGGGLLGAAAVRRRRKI